jgi:phage recombination protein Bet
MTLAGGTAANSLRELKTETKEQGLAIKMPKFFQELASTQGVDPKELWVVLKSTAFRCKDGPPTDEQMYALMMVSNAYKLNPLTREIFAFPDKQGIVPVVSVDGWTRIGNENPMMDGFEFRSSENFPKIDNDHKPCPEWMEVVVYRRDRSHPVVAREYLDECYRPRGNYKDGNPKPVGPWQTHTKRMLRNKALIQGFRMAFGFAGIYEEDEAQRIIEARMVDSGNGHDALPEGLDTSEFDRVAADVAQDPQFVQFLAETAQANGMTVDGLKVAAAQDFNGFVQNFQAWAEKVEKPKTKSKAKEEPKEEPEAAQPTTIPCPQLVDEESGQPMKVFVTKCEGCKDRPTCPSHEKA